MSEAGRHNHRADHMQLVQAVAAAALHAMDVGYNKGKGKVLRKYIDTLYRTNKSKGVEDVKNKFAGLLAGLGKKNGN